MHPISTPIFPEFQKRSFGFARSAPDFEKGDFRNNHATRSLRVERLLDRPGCARNLEREDTRAAKCPLDEALELLLASRNFSAARKRRKIRPLTQSMSCESLTTAPKARVSLYSEARACMCHLMVFRHCDIVREMPRESSLFAIGRLDRKNFMNLIKIRSLRRTEAHYAGRFTWEFMALSYLPRRIPSLAERHSQLEWFAQVVKRSRSRSRIRAASKLRVNAYIKSVLDPSCFIGEMRDNRGKIKRNARQSFNLHIPDRALDRK